MTAAADRFRISEQEDRGPYLLLLEYTVCLLLGHREGVLIYDTFTVVDAFDPEENEWYTYPEDAEEPYLGCIRCLAEMTVPLPDAVPVDIVDWA